MADSAPRSCRWYWADLRRLASFCRRGAWSSEGSRPGGWDVHLCHGRGDRSPSMGRAMRSARRSAEESAREALRHLQAERASRTVGHHPPEYWGRRSGHRCGRPGRLDEPRRRGLTGWTIAQASREAGSGGLPHCQRRNGRAGRAAGHPVLNTGVIVGLANHTALISKDGTTRPIDDSAAPIGTKGGSDWGVVLVFRDDTERERPSGSCGRARPARTASSRLRSTASSPSTTRERSSSSTRRPRRPSVIGRARGAGPGTVRAIIPPLVAGRPPPGVGPVPGHGRSAVLGSRIEVTAMRADGAEFPVELAITRIPTDGPAVVHGLLAGHHRTQAGRSGETPSEVDSRNSVGTSAWSSPRAPRWTRCSPAAPRRPSATSTGRSPDLDGRRGGDVLELRASAGMYTHLDGAHARVPVGQFKIGPIAQERRPHLTNAVLGDPRVPDQDWAEREGMVAFAGYPAGRRRSSGRRLGDVRPAPALR